MKTKRFKTIAAVLSCFGMLMSPVSAAVSAPAVLAPRDVSLHQGGVLLGQMLDPQGVAIAGATVSVRAAGKEVARVKTDQTGKFQIAGLKGGVHQVASTHQQGHQQGVYRLWAPQTAPPAAQQGLMLVSSDDLVRGQGCGCAVPNCGSGCGAGVAGGGGGIGDWIANHPIITAGAIGAAIAIPLVLDDDDDNPPATP